MRQLRRALLILATPPFFVVACSGGAKDVSIPTVAQDAAGPSGLLPSTLALDFGNIECGTSATSRTVDLKNIGSAAVTYTASLDDSSVFDLGEPKKATVAPDATASITITPKSIDTAAKAGVTLKSTLLITSDDPATPTLSIPITITPTGGTLDISPKSIDFGATPLVARLATVPVTLKNSGNEPIDVAVATTAAPFGFIWRGAPAPATLAAGATLDGAFATFTPAKTGEVAGSAVLSVKGTLCGGVVQAIPMRGEGTTGSAQVSPGTLDYRVSCGTSQTPTTQNVTVTNRGDALLQITNVAVDGPFRLDPAQKDTSIKPGASLTIGVAVQPAANGDQGGSNRTGTLHFDTNDSQQSHVSVPLTATVVGANLSFVDASQGPLAALDFGTVNVGSSRTLTLRLLNTGNDAATITPRTIGAPFAWATEAARTLPAGQMIAFALTFAPTDAVDSRANAHVDVSDGAICSPPGDVALSGTGFSQRKPPPPPPDASVRDAQPPPRPDAAPPADAGSDESSDDASSSSN